MIDDSEIINEAYDKSIIDNKLEEMYDDIIDTTDIELEMYDDIANIVDIKDPSDPNSYVYTDDNLKTLLPVLSAKLSDLGVKLDNSKLFDFLKYIADLVVSNMINEAHDEGILDIDKLENFISRN